MPKIDFLNRFAAARDTHLRCVDDDHEISAVDVRRKIGFIFAHEATRDLTGQAT